MIHIWKGDLLQKTEFSFGLTEYQSIYTHTCKYEGGKKTEQIVTSKYL